MTGPEARASGTLARSALWSSFLLKRLALILPCGEDRANVRASGRSPLQEAGAPAEEVVAVRRSNSRPTLNKLPGRLGWAAALAATVVVAGPLAASASPLGATPPARSAAVAGAVYGGITPQDFPVVIELNKKRSQVVRAAIVVRVTCASGALVNVPDGYRRVRVSKTGRFSTSFGPTTIRNDDGTTTDFEGTASGALNAARTKLSGKWQLKITDHNAAGAVTDTCDSGSVSWKAKQ